MAARLQDVILRGLAADKPVATTVAPGTLYYSTDTSVTERSSGTVWESYTDAGTGASTSDIKNQAITITHAQILTLNTTPQTIVTAPAAGFINLLVCVYFAHNYVAGVYTDPMIQTRYVGDTTDLVLAYSNSLNQAIRRYTQLPILASGIVASAADAKAIQVSTSFNPTGGNVANTMKVYAEYITIPAA